MKIYTGQTSQIPVKSSQGNSCVMVLYDYNSNYILTRATEKWTKEAMIEQYKKLHGTLVSWVSRPQMQILYH